MRRSTKGIVLALVVAAALLVAVNFQREDKESVEPPAQRVEAPKEPPAPQAPTPDVVLAIKPKGPAPAPAANPSSKNSPLMQELANGPRKPIYDRLALKTNRTPEENYVLARILETCTDYPARPKDTRNPDEERKRFAGTVSEKDPDRARRIAAFERSNAKSCEGLGDIKTTPAQVKELLDQAALGGDPKARMLLVSQEVWACCDGSKTIPTGTLPTISDEQLRTLRESVATGDPYAMQIAGSILSSTLGNLVIRTGEQERPLDQRAFYNAWMLAACDAGADCGPNNPMLLQGCASNGNCDAQNVRDYLFFYGNSPQQSQLITEYHAQLGRAMQTGDWSYFSFLRARPADGSTFFFGRPGP